ncbi:putative Cytochrome P450 [Seiridium cardinale]
MPIKHLVLVKRGAEFSQQDPIHIETDGFRTLEQFKQSIARAFSIANAESISLHIGPTATKLATLGEVKLHDGKIGIKIDGREIQPPRGPHEFPYVGNHFEIHPDHVGNVSRLLKRYGGVVKTSNMGTTIYVTNDPRVSEVILGENEFFTKTTSDSSHPLFYLKDNTALFACDTDAAAFKVSHKFIPPSMSPKAVRQHLPAIQRAVQDSFRAFDELDDKDLAFHLYQYMFKLGGQIVYKVVLGLDVGHFDSVDSKPHEIIHLMGSYLSLMKQTSLSPQWYKYLPFGKYRQLAHVRNRLWGRIDDAIRDVDSTAHMHMQQAAQHSDCIASYLQRATDDEGNMLPREFLLSNVVALVGAGLTTSSSMLSHLVYALAHYSHHHQESLLQELIDAGATADKITSWTYDELTTGLPAMDRFMKETLRLHSPAFQTARNAKRDVVVPGGWQIPKGAIVMPSFPAIHTHTDYWENPERFDPDRWIDLKPKHRMAYTPFAAGPRGCIAYNLAQLEAKVALAGLVYRYSFSDATDGPTIYDPEFLVIRPLNCYVRAVRRAAWPKSKSAG